MSAVWEDYLSVLLQCGMQLVFYAVLLVPRRALSTCLTSSCISYAFSSWTTVISSFRSGCIWCISDPEDCSSEHLSGACLRACRSATSSSCTLLRFHHGCRCRGHSGVASVLHFNTKASLCCCATSSCTSLVFIMDDCDELSVVFFLVRRSFGGLFL